MKVYYNDNFSGHPKYARPLQEIKLNKEFVWEDISGFIPAAYVGKEGMVVDFCIRVSNEAVQQFLDKWEQMLERHPDKEELEQMMEENPLTMDFNVKIIVNGKELENNSGCGTSYSKIVLEKYHSKKRHRPTEEEKVAQEYGCDDNASWYFLRHQCRWNKKPERLENLEIDFIAERKPYVAKKIELDLKCEEAVYEVTHPLTGEKYKLKIHETKQNALNPNIWKSIQERNPKMEYPTNYLTLSYELNPDLPEENFRLEDCSRGDAPRGRSEKKAAAVGIIAGTDVIGGVEGPTCLFIAGKSKKTRKRTAMSGLYFEVPEKLWWKAVFMEKERADMRMSITLSEKEA